MDAGCTCGVMAELSGVHLNGCPLQPVTAAPCTCDQWNLLFVDNGMHQESCMVPHREAMAALRAAALAPANAEYTPSTCTCGHTLGAHRLSGNSTACIVVACACPAFKSDEGLI